MKKFVVKISIAFIILISVMSVSVGWLFGFICPQYDKVYTAVITDKISYLKSIKEPKIILIGNSNLAFGIQSQKIEEAIGMPVVNLGLHGGLGDAFHENMAKFNIGEGDLVIACHTTYDSDMSADPALTWVTLENNFELWKILRFEDWLNILPSLPEYFLDCIVLKLGLNHQNVYKCYARNAFNKYGDNIYPRPNSEFTFTLGSILLPEIEETAINRLNKFNQYCKDRGANLLLAGYPIADGEFTPPKEEYIKFQEELENQVDCPIISDFTDYFMGYEYFYNTNLHLTDEGASLRTEQLINDIQAWKNAV